MNLRDLLCRLLARYGIYPAGCPPKPKIGADKATISVSQKDPKR